MPCSHASDLQLPVTIGHNSAFYRVDNALITVPLLVPGLLYTYNVHVEALDEAGAADVIRIWVSSARSTVPTISAIVNMPMTEPLEQQQ